MSVEQLASILWRRRWSFLVTFILCVAAVIVITLSLAKTYKATSTLFVGSPKEASAYFDTTVVEQRVRTYATLAENPNTAQNVVKLLPLQLTPTQLLGRLSFAPVERTQLLQVTAQGKSPLEAMRIANAYARVFVDQMRGLFVAGKAPSPISIAQAATLPAKPAKPNPPLYIALGTLLSLFIALGAALLRDRLDTRVRVGAADSTALEEPIVARIPTFASRDGQLPRGVSDRFEVLKTNLDFFGDGTTRVVLVTSPGGSEGKSTIATNLALAAARDGERVVLIEADLRRPGLDNTTVSRSADRSPVGLSNYLAGAATEEQVRAPHPEFPGLTVIWAGLTPPNPTALLSSHRLDTLLSSLRLDFDRIIIDTSPISVGADASVIASHADGTLYVIDERQTKRSEALAGLNQLRGVRARLLGVVLNRSKLVGAESYYYAPEQNGSRSRRSLRRRDRPKSLK
jgi:capsular exopolysaccharide synthesis family protein